MHTGHRCLCRRQEDLKVCSILSLVIAITCHLPFTEALLYCRTYTMTCIPHLLPHIENGGCDSYFYFVRSYGNCIHFWLFAACLATATASSLLSNLHDSDTKKKLTISQNGKAPLFVALTDLLCPDCPTQFESSVNAYRQQMFSPSVFTESKILLHHI